jgi:hypothetical protein
MRPETCKIRSTLGYWIVLFVSKLMTSLFVRVVLVTEWWATVERVAGDRSNILRNATHPNVDFAERHSSVASHS